MIRNVPFPPRRIVPMLAALLWIGCDKQEPTSPAGKPLAVAADVAAVTGLDFPSNGQSGADIRFRWTGSSLQPMYPATYIWRYNPRQQSGYYCTFYYGPASGWDANNYYGAPPYPDGSGDKSLSTTHHWSLGSSGHDYVADANGNNTQVAYGSWKIQALRVSKVTAGKLHEFFWDLPDTTKVIRVTLPSSYGNGPSNPALTVGDAPWSLRSERLSGILRGMQLYNAKLGGSDIVAEINAPLSTSAGTAAIWYLNLNPTPDDISDKSGKNHHPAWVSSTHAALWMESGSPSPTPPTVTLTANPTSVSSGGSSTLTWSSTNATGCTASGAWSGSKAISGSQSTGALSATSTFTLTCTGTGGSASQSATVTVGSSPPPAPTVSLSANPASVTQGGSTTLTWSSTNATGCTASGAWSGAKAVSGSQSSGPLSDTSLFSLTCTGAGGSASKSITVPANPPAPTVTLTANPTSVSSGGSSTLTWSSTNAAGCTASGAWSGSKATSGSQSTGALSATSSYTLTCTGAGGSASQSATVTVASGGGGSITGLVFNGNDNPYYDARFRFVGSNLQPMYPATYVFRVYPKPQKGYYTTFFWGPEGEYTGNGFYGAHPYPATVPPDESTTHNWEFSISGHDWINDANGHSTQLGYNVWRTQAVRVWDAGTSKMHEFYWDLPDTTKVIRVSVDPSYGPLSGRTNSLTFGNAQFSPISEHCNCILRGLQLYNANLSVKDILSEINTPMGTSAGNSAIWYLNLNPTPDDISDKSGKGHNPSWYNSSMKASLWTGP